MRIWLNHFIGQFFHSTWPICSLSALLYIYNICNRYDDKNIAPKQAVRLSARAFSGTCLFYVQSVVLKITLDSHIKSKCNSNFNITYSNRFLKLFSLSSLVSQCLAQQFKGYVFILFTTCWFFKKYQQYQQLYNSTVFEQVQTISKTA